MGTNSSLILPEFVRAPEAERSDGKRKSTRYAEIAEGLMVPPVSIGPKQAAWLKHELIALNLGRVAGLDNHGIRQLVSALIGMRGKLVTWDVINSLIEKLAPLTEASISDTATKHPHESSPRLRKQSSSPQTSANRPKLMRRARRNRWGPQ